jgi:hypothetical protein
MLVKFKRDYCVPLKNLNDKYMDSDFVFKSGYCYYGYFKDNEHFEPLVVESSDKNVTVELNRQQIMDYIE